MMHPVREHVLTLILHCINHKNTMATKQYMYLVRNKLLLLLLLIHRGQSWNGC